jgi:alkylation response protein AidB-like acyl-CoA dehydrogenase
MSGVSRTADFLRPGPPAELHCTPLLEPIAGQAEQADRTRTVSADVIAAIKASDLLALSATKELGGLEATVGEIGAELEAVAGACASTAWCLWNHLCVFHLFCGGLGPAHADLLAGIVRRHEWVCFPGGAGSRVYGRPGPEGIVLEGPSAFGSGSRYADWAGVAFAVVDPGTGRPGNPPDLRFSVVELSRPGVSVQPTWDGAALRASSTDHVTYDGAVLPAQRWAPWWGADRAEQLRDPATAVISPRYREDWVGLSDLWLAAMAVGVASRALEEAVEEVGGRRAIMGRPMTELAGVQFNLGRAALAVASARAAYQAGCAEVDARIDAGTIPTEEEYLRQMALSVDVLTRCDTAAGHLRKVLGGNGLRESHRFERRHRDLGAMSIHINAHEDRVSERVGRHLLGLEPGLF